MKGRGPAVEHVGKEARAWHVFSPGASSLAAVRGFSRLISDYVAEEKHQALAQSFPSDERSAAEKRH